MICLYYLRFSFIYFLLDSQILVVGIQSPTGSSVVLISRFPCKPGREGMCEMNKSCHDQKKKDCCGLSWCIKCSPDEAGNMSSRPIVGKLNFIQLHLERKDHSWRHCHGMLKNIKTQLPDKYSLILKRDNLNQFVQQRWKYSR